MFCPTSSTQNPNLKPLTGTVLYERSRSDVVDYCEKDYDRFSLTFPPQACGNYQVWVPIYSNYTKPSTRPLQSQTGKVDPGKCFVVDHKEQIIF